MFPVEVMGDKSTFFCGKIFIHSLYEVWVLSISFFFYLLSIYYSPPLFELQHSKETQRESETKNTNFEIYQTQIAEASY